MILVPRSVGIPLFVIMSVSLIVLGLVGYQALSKGGPSQESNRIEAEQFLYVALVCFSILLLAFFFLVGRSRSITKKLDRLIELSKIGDFSPELSMRTLGSIGEKITLLYFQLDALNEKRSTKISALSDLVEFLVVNLNLPILITDVTGKILYVSRAYDLKYEISRSEILSHDILETIPDASIQEIVQKLDKDHNSVERVFGKIESSIIPIYNRLNVLAYIIWAFDSAEVIASFSRKPEPYRRRFGFQNMLRRAFGRS